MSGELIQLNEKLNKSLHDDSKVWASTFKFVEDNTGVKRNYTFWGLVAFITLWLALDFAGQLVCNFIGVVYPAYCSIHAIESHDKQDDTKWLTYWIAFALFSVVEYFASIIAGWFPLYWLIKCLFLVWLMIPTSFNGSLFLYREVIKPYFLQYRNVVDDALQKAQSTASELLEHSKDK